MLALGVKIFDVLNKVFETDFDLIAESDDKSLLLTKKLILSYNISNKHRR